MLLGNDTKCGQSCTDSCYSPQFGMCMPNTASADCLEEIDPLFQQLTGTEDSITLKASIDSTNGEILSKNLVSRVVTTRNYIQLILATTVNENEKPPQTNLTTEEQEQFSSSSSSLTTSSASTNLILTSFLEQEAFNNSNGCTQCPSQCSAFEEELLRIQQDVNYQDLENIRRQSCYWRAIVGRLYKQFKVIASVSRSIQLIGHLLFSVRQVHEVIKPLLLPLNTITRKFTYRMKVLGQLEKNFQVGSLCASLKVFQVAVNNATKFHQLIKTQPNNSGIESQCSIDACKALGDAATALSNVSLPSMNWTLPTLLPLPFAGTRNTTVALNTLVNILQPLQQMLLNSYSACKPEGCRNLTGLQILIAKSQGDTDRLYEFVLRRINTFSLSIIRPVSYVANLLTDDQIQLPSGTWTVPSDFVSPVLNYESMGNVTSCVKSFTAGDNSLVAATS